MFKKITFVIFLIIVGIGARYLYAAFKNNKSPTSVTTTQTQSQLSTNTSFNSKQYSTTDPGSIWVIVNKQTPLPLTYEPRDLLVPAVPLRLGAAEMQMKIRSITAVDLTQLFTDSNAAGLQLQFGSGYRSAAYQKVLYDGYVSSMGKSEADRSSARPGHSEHQTGLALDFTRIDGKCHLDTCFADTEEGKWLAQNAYKYGFILRYSVDKEAITGYMFEPWHYRYVGKELAAQMHTTGIKTLEEFFNIGAAPDYN
ncbi:D-alanyl-D-alanine carboxypeptidase family protein [bacterium]|nr:D-alanyl-D-alanine carboxypeptidase family protein [bacterium]NBX98659.1 D-alanyl-D-alanine carboxypeptidase family protein [bacterium]NDC94096.1 D-alanyl-D-alanine carboxypeptidase family protein [bacterium]NDD83542.1 D-alanyl-D-alanine carboxypeptidase family protein [bacterium]NDG29343.1 D-alanyl-D-alanine carboxypeptidase family protein [bacterium]